METKVFKYGGKISTAVETHPIETETYEWKIKVTPSLLEKTIMNNIILLGNQKFTTGTLSKTDFCYVSGYLIRNEQKIEVSCLLPTIIERRFPKMKPFKLDLITNGKILNSTEHEFPPPVDGRYSFNRVEHKRLCFNQKISLTPTWNESLDTIRVTFYVEFDQIPDVYFPDRANMVIPRHMITPIMLKSAKLPGVEQLYNSPFLSDVTISCEGEVFPAHRLVLSLSSTVFLKMFEHDTKERNEGVVTIVDTPKAILTLLLQWMYTGDVEVNDLKTQVSLFKAAHKYCIDPLRNWCAFQIAGNIRIDNALEMFDMANTYEEGGILEAAKHIIKMNKAAVFQNFEVYQEFIEMYPTFMYELLLDEVVIVSIN